MNLVTHNIKHTMKTELDTSINRTYHPIPIIEWHVWNNTKSYIIGIILPIKRTTYNDTN